MRVGIWFIENLFDHVMHKLFNEFIIQSAFSSLAIALKCCTNSIAMHWIALEHHSIAASASASVSNATHPNRNNQINTNQHENRKISKSSDLAFRINEQWMPAFARPHPKVSWIKSATHFWLNYHWIYICNRIELHWIAILSLSAPVNFMSIHCVVCWLHVLSACICRRLQNQK